MQRKNRIAIIDWHDSCFNDGWQRKRVAGKHTISQCRTVGMFLKKTNNAVIVYQSRSDTDNIADEIAIPLTAIEKITYLNEP